MGSSMSDILLRDVNSERSDSILIRMGALGLISVPQSTDIVAHVVLEGRVTIETENMDRPTHLGPGEFALLHYGSKHCIYADSHRPAGKGAQISVWPTGDEPAELNVGKGPGQAKFLSAALRIIHRPTRTHGENPLDDIFCLKLEAKQLFKGRVILTDIEQIEAACHGPGANAFVNALMNLHLTHAMRCALFELSESIRDLPHSPYLMSSEKSRAVAIAVRLMRTHPEREWTVAKLAREIGLSRSTFAAIFCANVGCGPMELLNKLRMERAAELLAEQRLELPLLTIAIRVGYGAASSFGRAFKTHYGLSPRAYCKHHRNALPAS